MFLPVYVINLEQSNDRWEYISEQLDRLHVPYERFDAVDGRYIQDSLEKEIDNKRLSAGLKYKYPAGATGDHLSHVALWEKISESDHRGAFILEDDCILPDDFRDVIEGLSAKLFQQPIIIKMQVPLAESEDNRSNPDNLWSVPNCLSFFKLGEITNCRNIAMIVPVNHGSWAYYINKSAASILAKHGRKYELFTDVLMQSCKTTGVDVLDVIPYVVSHPKWSENQSIIGRSMPVSNIKLPLRNRITNHIRYRCSRIPLRMRIITVLGRHRYLFKRRKWLPLCLQYTTMMLYSFVLALLDILVSCYKLLRRIINSKSNFS